MTYAVAGVVRRGKHWHSRVESANAETSTHRQRVPTGPGSGVGCCHVASDAHRAVRARRCSRRRIRRGRRPDGSPQLRHAGDPAAARVRADRRASSSRRSAGTTTAGPAWYWNNFRSGEHTGTHFDAPNHWVTGQGGLDVASVPVGHLIRPAVVLDFSAQCADNPDFLLEVDDITTWEQEHEPLPDGGLAALPHRMGRPLRLPGAVHQRRRDRSAHAGHEPRVRAVGRAGVAGDRGRCRDRRHGRRCSTLLRPGVPVPLVPDGERQVRPDPAAEPRLPAAHRRRARGRSPADRHRLRRTGTRRSRSSSADRGR